MKYCCEGFAELAGVAGEKGIAIVPRKSGGIRRFFIQARPFDGDVVARYSATDPISGEVKWPKLMNERNEIVPYVSAMSIPLRFCPSCGCDLQSLIERNPSEFDAIARLSEPLFPSFPS